MRDFKVKPNSYTEVTVRNEWRRRSSEDAPPDSVLLDVGIKRPNMEWNSASLSPTRARQTAAALIKAADEAEA